MDWYTRWNDPRFSVDSGRGTFICNESSDLFLTNDETPFTDGKPNSIHMNRDVEQRPRRDTPNSGRYLDHLSRRRVSVHDDFDLTHPIPDDDHDYFDTDTLRDPFIQMTDDFSVSRQPETQFTGCEPNSTIYLGQRPKRRVSFQDDDHDYLDTDSMTPMFTYDDNQRLIP